MTNHRTRLLPLLLAIIPACAPSCAGTRARESVLLPAIRADWAAIRVEAERSAKALSPEGSPLIAQADHAIEVGSVPLIVAVDWATIDALAAADVQRREDMAEIGTGVAASLRERHRLFIEARRTFTTTPTTTK